ncbi:MAG: hypothetical protein HC771_17945 [Synechococcales cyanobacterium CRU_2_2]|nr:hypothetical protein [Synechococcales cyanobacterium CRU_2_2]
MSLRFFDQLKCSQITEAAPRVSVGLPVHNGENYLEEAIAPSWPRPSGILS